jgi:hypothetical protein
VGKLRSVVEDEGQPAGLRWHQLGVGLPGTKCVNGLGVWGEMGVVLE